MPDTKLFKIHRLDSTTSSDSESIPVTRVLFNFYFDGVIKRALLFAFQHCYILTILELGANVTPSLDHADFPTKSIEDNCSDYPFLKFSLFVVVGFFLDIGIEAIRISANEL